MGKPANGQALIQAFEQWVPKSLAIGKDREKIGLQVGTLNKPVKTIMVALDVLENVVDEAIENEVDLIVAHHPLIFHPLKKIAVDSPHGRIIEKCIKHDITVYAAHTNLDVAKGGVNDLMAEALGLQDTDILAPTGTGQLKKLVVFVPQDHAESVRQAIGNAGAGFIGNYSHCTFNSQGTGTFMPQEGTNPYIGSTGKLEKVEEVKIETILPAKRQSAVVRAMLAAHPYEEAAYDIYPLDNEGEVYGAGRIGMMAEEMTLRDFAEHVKKAFDVEGVRVVGNLNETIKKVAVLGGSGDDFMNHVQFKGADVYVTGDVYYHTAHDAWMEGLNVVDPGHNVEKVMKEGVRRFFADFIEKKNYETKVLASALNTDPFTFL
ncbi:MAG TPA: Nif3-like dinuclear metal center hexameric protein [Bacillales bacterium]|nr:Nif3-like dinuclear metal center hexameric protein [Bacillales bacterium]